MLLGPDLYDGTTAQLAEFGTFTGATYPLLLQGGPGKGNNGNENLFVPYGSYDNYAVINKQGILRYLAYDLWPHGNRYHLNEIRGCVDSLVSGNVDVGDGPASAAFALEAAPNPFNGRTTLTLANPSGRDLEAHVAVYDLAGRPVAQLWEAPIPPGINRLSWNGRVGQGTAGPGVYLIRAKLGGVRLTRRVVLIP